MNRLTKLWLTTLAALVLVAVPLAARAQNLKPVAVISIASIKDNLDDVAYITRTAGMEDAGKSVMFFANALTAGLDKQRPGGLYVVPQAGDFHAVAFIAVENLKTLFEVQKEYIGTPEDVGNGIQKIGTDRTAYLKQQGGWAFLAEEKEHLGTLPQDPLALLGDLPKTYNVAAKIMVQNVPQELRRMAIDQIKLGMERGLSAPRGKRSGGFDPQEAAQLARFGLGNLERLINETDEVLIGLGVNADQKHLVLDIGVLAKEGTALARQMALQTDLKTSFSGFVTPDASVIFTGASRSTPEEIEQIGPALKAARELWTRQIDDLPQVPADKRDAVKRVLGEFIDVLEKTAATGRSDLAGSLVLLPKSISFVAATYVADGAAVEKAIKDSLELAKGFAKNPANFPTVQFNAGTHGQVRLHKLTARIPQPEARELLGEQLEVILGIGPQSVVLSAGKDAEKLLKSALDRSAAEPDKSVPPGQFRVMLLPILKFYKSVDDNPIVGGLISSLEQSGNDQITVVSQAGPRSTKVRVEIQEGLIKAAGEAAKAFGAGPR